jgi:voltage-gated potassium channel
MANERFSHLDLLILGLSVYVLVAMAAMAVLPLDPGTVRILLISDVVVCVVFMADFFTRLYRADNKWRFMRWGWIDFVASIPMVDSLRWGRLFRIVRILRLLRAFKSAKTLTSFLFRNQTQGALVITGFTAFMALFLGALSVYEVEAAHPDANITTAPDALWWAFVTVTTVGYGDFYPVTTEGRLIAAVLMAVGIGTFGVLLGSVASLLLTPKDQKLDTANLPPAELDKLAHELIRRIEDRSWNRNPSKLDKS